MSFPIADVLAATLERRKDQFRRLIENSNPVLQALRVGRLSNERRRGVKWDKSVQGGTQIVIPITYKNTSSGVNADGTGWYRGADQLTANIVESSALARYDWAQYGRYIGVSRRDLLINSGETAIINLLTHKIESAMIDIANDFHASLMSTTVHVNGIVPLPVIISSTPSSGTLGGIDRSSNSWWRNIYGQLTTNASSSFDGRAENSLSARVLNAISQMLLLLDRGGTRCNVILAGKRWWDALNIATQSIRRISSEDPIAADLGIESISFNGVPIIPLYGYDYSNTANNFQYNSFADDIFFINTDVLYLATHPECNFIQVKKTPFNQDVEGIFIFWMGQVVCEAPNMLARLNTTINVV